MDRISALTYCVLTVITILYALESLFVEGCENLRFQRYFGAKKFCYVNFLFMRGKSLYLLNRKNLNAILEPNYGPLVTTLYIKGF